MKLIAAFVLLSLAQASAAVLYVDINSTNPVAPFTGWPTAAANIQDAVDAASAGDTVLVTDGVYSLGQRDVGDGPSRVTVTNGISLRSINGPQFTVIDGGGTNRCISLTDNATLSGFTLTNGSATGCLCDSGAGGGVWCASPNVFLTNCVVAGNSAFDGGGVSDGTLYNCSLSANSAVSIFGSGGGVFFSTLYNCTLSGNYSGNQGGAAHSSILYNCALIGNSAATEGGGAYNCTLYDCTLNSNTVIGGSAYFIYGGGADNCHLYNCTLSGNEAVDSSGPNQGSGTGGGAYNSGLYNCILTANRADYCGGAFYCGLYNCTLTGNSAIYQDGGVANCTLYNCIIYYNSAANGANYDFEGLSKLWYCCTMPDPGGYGNITNNPLFVDYASGNLRLQSNSPCIDAGTNAYVFTATDLDGHSRIFGGRVDMGAYEFRPAASGIVRYVNVNSTNAVPPFLQWATAATNIQQAVSAAGVGDEVLVTNGVYPGTVAVSDSVTLRSVNGPQFTIVDGGGTNPCASLADGASLTGFTLTNGYTYGSNGGGGVTCTSTNAFLTDCVIVGCSGLWSGGAYGGALYNCTLNNNSAIFAYLSGQGSGAIGSTLYNCTLTGNSGSAAGAWCTLYNCTLTGNYDGGAYHSTLYNCTLTGNSAYYGGGVYDSTLYNCIVFFNSATAGANYDTNSTLNYCCTTPDPGGTGNITNEPLFISLTTGNTRLQSNSPCINAGNNAYVSTATDLDGRPRIVDGTVDMGAFEFQPGISGAFIGWLHQYGLPTNGSADSADSDGDGMNNLQEWIAGTNPTNALSVLKMFAPSKTASGIAASWQSVNGITYFLQRCTNLKAQPAFTSVQSNLVGQIGTTVFIDTNAVGQGPFFYRVGVQQ
jgi:parallel beta-helix repeat protein